MQQRAAYPDGVSVTQGNSATPDGVRQGVYRCLLSAVVRAAQNPEFRAALTGASAAIRLQVSHMQDIELAQCCIGILAWCAVALNTNAMYGTQALLDAGTFQTDDARSEAAAALKAVGASIA